MPSSNKVAPAGTASKVRLTKPWIRTSPPTTSITSSTPPRRLETGTGSSANSGTVTQHPRHWLEQRDLQSVTCWREIRTSGSPIAILTRRVPVVHDNRSWRPDLRGRHSRRSAALPPGSCRWRHLGLPPPPAAIRSHRRLSPSPPGDQRRPNTGRDGGPIRRPSVVPVAIARA